MRNAVPEPARTGARLADPADPAAPAARDGDVLLSEGLVLRTLAARVDTYTDEVERLLRAGYAVMSRTQTVSPRVSDIVRESGLSNQAFYRHFRSRDELLLALLASGRHSLVEYVRHRMAKERSPAGQVRRWVEAILAQAADARAAEATRPFARNRLYLASQFPDEVRRADDDLRALVQPALSAGKAAGEWPAVQPDRDSLALYQLVMGTMQAWLLAEFTPSPADITHVGQFALAGLDRSRPRERRHEKGTAWSGS
jgi:AcrR family transcriptional regulator